MTNDISNEGENRQLLPVSEWQRLVRDLERCYASGDRKKTGEAFFDLQQQVGPWLVNLSKSKIGSEEDAKEVMADVYLDLHKYLEQGNSVENIKAFLRTLVNRRAIDIFRKQKKSDQQTDSLDDEALEEIRDEGNPYEEVDAQLDFNGLSNLLLNLMPSPEKEILFLRHYGGLGIKETALRLNLSEDVVKKRTQKAIDLARQLVIEQGMEL